MIKNLISFNEYKQRVFIDTRHTDLENFFDSNEYNMNMINSYKTSVLLLLNQYNIKYNYYIKHFVWNHV